MDKSMEREHYIRFLVMAVLSFIAMYILMYAMVNRFSDVYANFNQIYMAGLMTAPMVIFEILLMGMMYKNKKLNALIVAGGGIALVVFFLLIRQQTAIGDEQFLRSMIPHHSGAILMCQEASIKNPQIKDLCTSIISGQQREIDEMSALLFDLKRK